MTNTNNRDKAVIKTMNKFKNKHVLASGPIYYGSRGDDFKAMIHNILKRSKLKIKFMDILLSKESMELYAKAFTSSLVDKNNNYESYEQDGDLTGNKIIVAYMKKRFPILKTSEHVPVVARLKINYGSDKSFSKFADKLGFWPFITTTEELKEIGKNKLLEDCFEAFLGVTEEILDTYYDTIGVGYSICYDILSSIFDEEKISLRYLDLFDSKTRLKEIFDVQDYKSTLGNKPIYGVYETEELNQTVRVFGFITKEKPDGIELGYAQIFGSQKNAEMQAAEMAIRNLRGMGYKKDTPQLYVNLEKKLSS